MPLADRIRAHLVEKHLLPSRERGESFIELRAGDIHAELKLTGRMPAICSAMGGRKLLAEAGVELVSRRGPPQGANVWFKYTLLTTACQSLPKKRTEVGLPSKSFRAVQTPSPQLKNALILVSCTKRKLSAAAPARELYNSNFFKSARHLVEKSNADWRILSAKHGLLKPEAVIAPYEMTLKTMKTVEQKRWAEAVLKDLLPLARNYGHVIFLAGQNYRVHLVPALAAARIKCEAPMAHLRQGEQVAWLNNQ